MKSSPNEPGKQHKIQHPTDPQNHFRILFETMPLGVVFQNADGMITDANPAAERILGLTLEQLQGRRSTDPRGKAVHIDAQPGRGTRLSICLPAREGTS